MCLKGIVEGSKMRGTPIELKLIMAVQWYKSRLEGSCCAIGQHRSAVTGKAKETVPQEIQQVLRDCDDVF